MLAIGTYVTHTVSLPELIWTIITGIGAYLNSILTKDAVHDLKQLRRAKINSIREFAAISAVMQESLKLLIQFTLFMIGVINMFIPAASPAKVPASQWVNTIAFVILAFIITGSAFIERIRRQRLIQLILEYEKF